MLRVGFEPMIQVFERTKTVHALHLAATVIGKVSNTPHFAVSWGPALNTNLGPLGLATAAARVRSRVWSSGICGGQSGAGAGFLRVLRFPLPRAPGTLEPSLAEGLSLQ
jgi:hypothetical protein